MVACIFALGLWATLGVRAQLSTRTTDLGSPYVYTFSADDRVYAIASNGHIVTLQKDAVDAFGYLKDGDGNIISDVQRCRRIGTDSIACITVRGDVHLFNHRLQILAKYEHGSNEPIQDIAKISPSFFLVLTRSGSCYAMNSTTQIRNTEPVCSNAILLSRARSGCFVSMMDRTIMKVSQSVDGSSMLIDTILSDAPGWVVAMEMDSTEDHAFLATRDSSMNALYVLKLRDRSLSQLLQHSLQPVLLQRFEDTVMACYGKDISVLTYEQLEKPRNSDTAALLELYTPISFCTQGGRVFVVGDHSLLMSVAQGEPWSVMSYLPRKPLNSYTHLSTTGQRLITRHSYHTLPIRMGRNEFEWEPVATAGTCTFQGSFRGQQISPNGSIVTMWSGFPSWTTTVGPSAYESDCMQSDYVPDSWCYLQEDTAIGYSMFGQFFTRSVDAGRTWSRIGTLDANGVTFLGSSGDTVYAMLANNAGLDTSIYKTSHSLTFAKLVRGTVVYDSVMKEVAELRSYRWHRGELYAVVRSNRKADGDLRSFCKISLSPWKSEVLFSIDSLAFGDFDFMGSTVVFTAVRGNVLTYDLMSSQPPHVIRVLNSETSFASHIRFIRDSVAIVTVGGEIQPGLQRIEFFQSPASVEVEEASARPQVTGVLSIRPNPTNEYVTISLVIASEGDVHDLQVTIASALGTTVESFPLHTRVGTSNSAGEHTLQISTKDLDPGVYMINVRSSRNAHSVPLIVRH
ncbi:MAG: T9SS type A sorting domain-containing protein [Bacteroidetes bacterium]|nr:T9SS type A sorting domain-containing protein [Bacteroidota bacterium]